MDNIRKEIQKFKDVIWASSFLLLEVSWQGAGGGGGGVRCWGRVPARCPALSHEIIKTCLNALPHGIKA